MLNLEPEGCFTLLDGQERIGIATTVSYGSVGWFGNLIVRPDKRIRGAGSMLVKHALEYLTRRNVKTVGLYSYTERIPFYQKLGFQNDSEFIALKGKAFTSPMNAELQKATKAHAQAIAKVDEECFGGTRTKLLEIIMADPDNRAYAFSENGKLSAFIMSKVYNGSADVGPLVCEHGQIDVAVQLLKQTLNDLNPREVSVCLSRKESAILDLLKEHGFSESFRVTRMFRGPFVGGDCIYFAESLERG